MKILYGVQGTGNGHIARARAMCDVLKVRGIDVDFLFSGRDKNKYFSMEQFGHFQTRRGLTFSTEKGRVNYFKTATSNSLLEFYNDVTSLDLADYDLVLNDFEPVSAWAAKLQGKPVVSISHQNAFRYPVPLKGASWLDKMVIRYFAPSQHHIGLHWYHFNQPILPPIVHTHKDQVESEAFVLVYLPFESLEDITDLLLRFKSQMFVCYHPDVMEAKQVDNIEYLPLSFEHFHHHMNRCAGIIANGGFELPSEALTLGKKLLLKPLSGQFEQMSNVATLETLGLASSMEVLDAALVRTWLDEAPGESVDYPNVAEAIVDWLLEGDWDNTRYLTSQLWSKVDFPSYAMNV
ncbi:MJ1255/VC2487 family glycosyltransferase [Vibrio sp. LaRot3]|uniref:MJ1255/VC2487 family glycosyltransferase n=1 Tax=Vibrio sp. LaRot3 TaxID=2998829 RepID=UPI0022CE2C75|nr:MJ1255/VC2487 family glycosyltransferase [Vibrio sp. LaRot3]MDA0149681.1 glycosyltransferase [Vibrio sp. LaRot3]